MSQKIFISHSSKDKPFVRKLDSALISSGLNVFLDEREIKVGDSIPDAIYKVLSVSTHIIYVISSNSINSEWVKEELSIAKMRQKENCGVKILPILLEEVELPTSVRHIKYSSFIGWQSSKIFMSSMDEIYDSLGVSLKHAENMEKSFYFEFIQLYAEVERITTELASIIDTALSATIGFAPNTINSMSQGIVKYMLQTINIDKLEEFYKSANDFHDWENDSIIRVIMDLICEFDGYLQCQREYTHIYRIPANRLKPSKEVLNRLSGVMESMRLDVCSSISVNNAQQ